MPIYNDPKLAKAPDVMGHGRMIKAMRGQTEYKTPKVWREIQDAIMLEAAKRLQAAISEGPRHDPYSYSEYTVKRLGNCVTYHFGLAEWIEIQGPNEKKARHFDQPKDVDTVFAMLTGFSFTEWRKFLGRLEAARYRRHRGHDVVDQSGFPGEHFTYCKTCGDVIESFFNESEIE